MFSAAAHALSSLVTDLDLKEGRIYPALHRIRDVSAWIAVATAKVALDEGLAEAERPADLEATVRGAMYEPQYQAYV
jgi:malate dehydrogenase (oxaloacetate-decarboxylating)(NADP+)